MAHNSCKVVLLAFCLFGLTVTDKAMAQAQAPAQATPGQITPEAVARTQAQPYQPPTAAVVEAQNAVAQARAAFIESYGRGDVAGVMSHYLPNATFAGTLQPFWMEGTTAIQDLWTRYFATFSRHHMLMRQPVVSVAGDTAVETGYMEMYMGNEGAAIIPTYIRYSITRVKTPDGWKILNMNVARMPGQG